jgi:hypothetical protein
LTAQVWWAALRARLAALTESAAYDPEAQMRLARLQQVWEGGVGQQFEELRAQMKAMMRNGAESLERPDDKAGKRQISMTSCRPPNKKMRKKIRCLG